MMPYKILNFVILNAKYQRKRLRLNAETSTQK